MKRLLTTILAKIGYKLIKSNPFDRLNFVDHYDHNLSQSLKESLGPKSEPMPWITYPAYEYLNQIDLSQLNVFEFGAGNSTVYFSRRSNSVTSVEHNQLWFETLKSKKLDNVKLIHAEEQEYAGKIIQQDIHFDIVLVDAILREACVRTALKKLNRNGIIILDNSDRTPELCKVLRNNGLLQIDFKGFGPINRFAWCTSFFFSSISNPPFKSHIPSKPIGDEQSHIEYFQSFK